jgi:3-oxoacyl-[acyl-carrier protein] reductase
VNEKELPPRRAGDRCGTQHRPRDGESACRGGAAIIVNVRSNKAEADQVVREIERDGGKATAAVFDVADEKAVTGGVTEAVKQLGRVDYLINNAALRQERSFEEMSFKEWRDVLGVTLDGAFHCAKACLPYLKASGAGAIVNIGGLSAHTGSAHRAHVTAAKLGLVGFTRGSRTISRRASR